jgi:ATP-dependent helicase/nuclease subunit A
MSDPKPTRDQERAIKSAAQTILVSAGAGGGKTSVLVDRCVHLIAESRPPCPIDRLLIVTFTDAAAAQMRQRIATALRKRLAQHPDNRFIATQLSFLGSANICTLHAFCRRVLSRYFAQADLDPQMPLLDAHDAAILRRQTAAQVFDAMMDRDDAKGEAWRSLVACYSSRSDNILIDIIMRTAAFLESLPDPDAWMQEATARLDIPPGGIPEFWATQLHEVLRNELSGQCDAAAAILATLPDSPDWASGMKEAASRYQNAIAEWQDLLGRDHSAMWKALGQIAAYEFPGLPDRRSGAYKKLAQDEKDRFSKLLDSVKSLRDDQFKARLQTDWASFTITEWGDGIARIRPHVVALVGAVDQYRVAYETAKQDAGALDFADLERKTYDLLRDDTNGVARRLRDDLRHILVDEFQDINPLQERILNLLRPTTGSLGSIFAVGDVKQSIYRFRLAEPQLFLDLRDSLSAGGADSANDSGELIDLRENFRSSAPVIEAINRIFERLFTREFGGLEYDEHARLIAGRSQAPALPNPAIELHVLEDMARTADSDELASDESSSLEWERIEREAYVIAERIKSLASQGIAFGDIVILMRSLQARASLLVRTLLKLDVPVLADIGGGLFESLEVMDVLSLLSLIDNQEQDIPWAAVLRSPLTNPALTDDELAEIRSHSPKDTFCAAVRNYVTDGSNSELRTSLTKIIARIANWRRTTRLTPLADVLWSIYEQTGYLAYVSGLKDAALRRSHLLTLHDYARQFGAFHRQGLHHFLRFLEQVSQADENLEARPVAATAIDAVRLMTIHRSKGLEFPVVILADAGKRFNLRDMQESIVFDRRLGPGLEAVDLNRRIRYPTLPYRLAQRAARRESLEEEARLLYVALTRAKEHIVLIGTGLLSKIEDYRNLFDAHKGPLPLAARQDVQTMLDWLLATISCQPGDDRLFLVRSYARDEIAGWTIDPPQHPGLKERLRRCAELESLDVAPHENETVERVKRRLTTPYAGHELTQVPAVVAASAIKRRWTAADEEVADWDGLQAKPAQFSTDWSLQFPPPAILALQARSDPTVVGTLTHEFLQLANLSRSCDAEDLASQLNELIEAGVFTQQEARLIDAAPIEWFFTTDVGQRMRGGTARVLREWPFVMSIDPRRYDPRAAALGPDDTVLVRGIIDCLIETPDGWEIIDYKTDAVSGDALRERAEAYRGQLEIYAAAVQATWTKPIVARRLIFLAARQIVSA